MPVRVTAAGPNSVTPGSGCRAGRGRRAGTASRQHRLPLQPDLDLLGRHPALPRRAASPKWRPADWSPLCVPLNVFGTNVASQAAINYVAPGITNPGIADQVTFVMQQSVFSASAQGVLPWGLPAGKVAVAFGGEYRLEQQTRYPRSAADRRNSGMGRRQFRPVLRCQYNVKEGFLEVNAPILKDNFVQSLDFNAAGRFTSYSTSGARPDLETRSDQPGQ